jgi:hypothetical protein
MSFTAKELDSFVDNLNDEEVYDESKGEYVPNPNFNSEWEDYDNPWMDIYYGEHNSVETPWGTLEKVKSWGGEGDGAEIYLVVKVGDRLFRKAGYYSSWDSSSMDSPLVEVEEYVEPTTYYRKKS